MKKLDRLYSQMMSSRVLPTGKGTAAFPDIEGRRAKAMKHWHQRKRAGKVAVGEFGGWGQLGLRKRYTSAGLARAKKLGVKWTPLDPRLAEEVHGDRPRDAYDPYGWERKRQTEIRKKGMKSVRHPKGPKTKAPHIYYSRHHSSGGGRR